MRQMSASPRIAEPYRDRTSEVGRAVGKFALDTATAPERSAR
jgi:hypothetical protein